MKALRILALALSLSAAVVEAGAFSLEPMSALLAPTGAGRIATFRVKNESGDRVAIKFSVLTREIAPDGKELNGPADSLFTIFPSRILVEPGATAIAKVQWKGPSTINEERCFRFVAEELGVDSTPSASSGIKMRFRYIASLYVGQSIFSAKLEAKATGAEGPNGEKGLQVEVKNVGRRHVVTSNATLRLTVENGTELTLSSPSDGLGALNGVNYLPGTTRIAFIPREDALVGKSYGAQLDYESLY